MKALLRMRRDLRERELEALLSGDQDQCSCFIEVINCFVVLLIMILTGLQFTLNEKMDVIFILSSTHLRC